MSRLNLKTNRVQSSFKTLQKRLFVLVRRINSEAASQMKAGQYETAKGLMDIGRSFSDFASRSDKFSQDWEQLASETTSKLAELGIPVGTQKKIMSAKALTVSVLRFVVNQGGSAEMPDVVTALGNGNTIWTDADLAESQGSPRWHLTLNKAYRRSQRLGLITKRGDGVWEITEKGRTAAIDGSA